jgi:tRNA(Ile)-lysidine synthase
VNCVSEVLPAIRRFFNKHTIEGPGIVAVSGGADSVSLLSGLSAHQYGPLIVAHFNHQLRGAESDADEQFVQSLAQQFGCEFQSRGHAIFREGGNLEAVSRRFRYDWLVELARVKKARWIATGHTADDQAETVLHRLIRGTGIQGLRGIAPMRKVTHDSGSEIRIIRPMLRVTKAEIMLYIEQNELTYRTDSSNADRRFTRNRIRQELMPLLQTYNGKVVESLGRLSEQAGELYAYIENEALANLAYVELPRAGRVVVLDRAKCASLANHQVRELLRLIWAREAWPQKDMSYDHWQTVLSIIHGLRSADDMPGVLVTSTPHVVRIDPRP